MTTFSAENLESLRNRKRKTSNLFGSKEQTLDLCREKEITRKEHWRNGIPLIPCESEGKKYTGYPHRPKGMKHKQSIYLYNHLWRNGVYRYC